MPTTPRLRLVALTGAGMSAESGIPTFRGNGGLWENHDVRQVATPEAWARDRALVLRFYNERRRRMWECEPHEGHRGLVRLERRFDVEIVTQNVDNLHERAGSTRVLHLHGELAKARSSLDHRIVHDLGRRELNVGDKCERGSQLRPHIVWFGEQVPLFPQAREIVAAADILAVIGTSLQVYPAASLIDHAPAHCRIYLVDPEPATAGDRVTVLRLPASQGVAELERRLADEG